MAKRNNNKNSRRRKKFTGVNIMLAAEGIAYANLMTQTAFKVNPLQFLLGDSTSPAVKRTLGVTGSGIGIGELLGLNPSYDVGAAWEAAAENTREAGMTAIVQSIGMGIGFTMLHKVSKRPRAKINQFLRNVGAGDFVRV